MKHELLAPAGSFDICKAVIQAGADAVYLGGAKYGARAFAANLSEEEMLRALDYAHLRGKKIFLTVNTLLKNRETGKELYQYLKPYYTHGLDAIIIQDYGVFQFVRKYFPELPVHISTQMSVSGVQGARFLKERGAARIVTARELSLQEIRNIYDETGVEIESFIHGALCYCYSGQCLMSSMLGGRSGNRGRCAQPCRLSYEVVNERGDSLHKKEKYPISPKDLCALEILPELCKAGIYSFKIEGRMKSLEYAAGVTQIYREYLDRIQQSAESWHVDQKDYEYLFSLGNRNGFTQGYYVMRNGRSMMTLTDSSHSSVQAKDVFRGVYEDRIPVHAEAILKEEELMQLSLSSDNYHVDVTGDTVMTAQNRPLTETEVRKQLSKMGDSSFELSDLTITLGKNCFAPVKQLNALRRSALASLENKILSGYKRTLYESGESDSFIHDSTTEIAIENNEYNPCLNVFVSTQEQLEEVLKYPFVNRVSLDLNFPWEEENGILADRLCMLREQIHAAGKEAMFCFPYVFRAESEKVYSQNVWKEAIASFDAVWVRSFDSLGFVWYEMKLPPEKIRMDYNLYVYSENAYRAFASDGLIHYTASLELNRKELRHMPNENAEIFVYGYTPMMISAQCVYKNYSGCYRKKADSGSLYLRDRYFKQFLITRNCKDCYNIIYNSQPMYLFHQSDTVKKMSFGSCRISFVAEDRQEIRSILNDYRASFLDGKTINAPAGKDRFTNGHFNRGID